MPAAMEPARRVSRWLMPALLLTVYVGQCLWFIHTQSLTVDEPVHIIAGIEAWHGRFASWNDHPPLARMLCALPLLYTGLDMGYSGRSPDMIQVHSMRPGPREVAWLARPPNVALGVLLGILVWCAARRFFSHAAAHFALALFVLSPGMVAHFSVVTTDGAGILTIFACAYQLVRWRRNPSVGNTVLLGFVSAAMLLAKFYSPLIFLLMIGAVLATPSISDAAGRFSPNWKAALMVAVIAIVVVSGAYGFHITRFDFHDHVLTASIPGSGAPVSAYVPLGMSLTLWAPAGEYAYGLYGVARHNLDGHASYLFGRVAPFGFAYYYPAVIAMKWPALVLALAVAGLALLRKTAMRARNELGIMLLFPATFIVVLISSHIQVGDRHALPLYPFLLLCAAAVWEVGSTKRWVKIALLAVVAVQGADTLRVAPCYLGYFNPWVRADKAYSYVSDSNLDWGQGLIALREWQTRHPAEILSIAHFGSVDPPLYGLRGAVLRPGERVTGTVAVSMTALTGQYLPPDANYRWLLGYPVHDIVNRSIVIFDVPETANTQTIVPRSR